MCLNVWRRVTLTVNTPNLKETAGLTEFGELLLLLQLSSWRSKVVTGKLQRLKEIILETEMLL